MKRIILKGAHLQPNESISFNSSKKWHITIWYSSKTKITRIRLHPFRALRYNVGSEVRNMIYRIQSNSTEYVTIKVTIKVTDYNLIKT
jgi:hypothetical protein